jgi:hypothetical protein
LQKLHQRHLVHGVCPDRTAGWARLGGSIDVFVKPRFHFGENDEIRRQTKASPSEIRHVSGLPPIP